MKDKIGKTVHLDIFNSTSENNGIILGKSHKGKSLIDHGNTLELIKSKGSILISSLQRELGFSYEYAEKIITDLLKKGLIEKHQDNHSYILKSGVS
jgi:predicted HTH transcriptional regulator